jgi:hypothetical protein
MSVLEIVCQTMIFICGAGSIYLLSRNDKYSKYGMVLGLVSQPFWYITAYLTNSYGIFAVNLVYTMSYINGIFKWFYSHKK